MGFKKTVPIAPVTLVIPVRNPRRELYELIHAEPSATWCMARDKAQPKERIVAKLVKKLFKPSKSDRSKSPILTNDAKKVTSRLDHSSPLRFVRRLYPEDDEEHGYSGDNEDSEGEEWDDEEDMPMVEESKDLEEIEEVDLKPTPSDFEATSIPGTRACRTNSSRHGWPRPTPRLSPLPLTPAGARQASTPASSRLRPRVGPSFQRFNWVRSHSKTQR
ncbi:hypothetical protein B0J13DRAFT_559910 [Dactylonectria estremocensis]|uniref:Uncharacterized protein n=1 Tax=Dactylonectria estremocensis TaxID=1079267 RepID=A0A9P9J057_9HYPO|nr:hypothetical protein B0J13DRAFT_559910 [Dactylonectria estremocensis]